MDYDPQSQAEDRLRVKMERQAEKDAAFRAGVLETLRVITAEDFWEPEDEEHFRALLLGTAPPPSATPNEET